MVDAEPSDDDGGFEESSTKARANRRPLLVPCKQPNELPRIGSLKNAGCCSQLLLSSGATEEPTACARGLRNVYASTTSQVGKWEP
jgi:hypothetical protein